VLPRLNAKVGEYGKRFGRIEKIAAEFRASFKTLGNHDPGYTAFGPIIEATFLERPLVNAVLIQKIFPAGPASDITAGLRGLDTEITGLRKDGEEMLTMSKDLDRAARDKAERSIRTSQTAALILFPLSLFFGIGTLFAISRSVVRSLKNLTSAIEQAGRGDFAELPVPQQGDEVAVLIETFNKMESDLVARDRELASKREELFQSRKLASIGTLASGVAHELNNPLYGIMNTLELMKTEVDPQSRRRRLLDMALSEIVRLTDLLRKMLSFSKPDQDEKQPVDMNAILDEILLLHEKQLRENDIHLSHSYGEGLGKVLASKNQLRQVFLNMISNARDAMPDGGTLTVSTRQEGKNILVEVTDTGIGIPPENQEKIFDAFFTTKDSVKGVGLGLSVCYVFIREHNGDIQVRSEVGAGTTFTVILPACE